MLIFINLNLDKVLSFLVKGGDIGSLFSIEERDLEICMWEIVGEI